MNVSTATQDPDKEKHVLWIEKNNDRTHNINAYINTIKLKMDLNNWYQSHDIELIPNTKAIVWLMHGTYIRW